MRKLEVEGVELGELAWILTKGYLDGFGYLVGLYGLEGKIEGLRDLVGRRNARASLYLYVLGCEQGKRQRGGRSYPYPCKRHSPVTGEEGAGGARWASRVGRPPAAPSQPGTRAFPLVALTRMRLPVSNQHGARSDLYQAGARDYSTCTRHRSDHVFDARLGTPSRRSSGAPRLRIGALSDTSSR